MSIETSQSDHYDPHLTPAETAAREEREQENFQEFPDEEADTDSKKTGGYAVDREGLANNYAIEPEVYVEEPGDLKEKEEQQKKERAEELKQVRQHGTKGPGVI